MSGNEGRHGRIIIQQLKLGLLVRLDAERFHDGRLYSEVQKVLVSWRRG